jgi:hypothetical protein
MTDRETLKAVQVDSEQVRRWIAEVWHLWQSDDGGYYATRSGALTAKQMDAGYFMTVPADSEEERRSLLLKQPDAPKDGAAR